MDVILTISVKITAEIDITKHRFCVLLCRRGRLLAFCKTLNFHSFIAMGHVYIVFSLLIAR